MKIAPTFLHTFYHTTPTNYTLITYNYYKENKMVIPFIQQKYIFTALQLQTNGASGTPTLTKKFCCDETRRITITSTMLSANGRKRYENFDYNRLV